MNRKVVLSVVVIVVAVVASYSVWSYISYLDYSNKTVHETGRWAVIMDSKGDIIAVETTSDDVWDQMIELYGNKEEKWIGGIVEEFNNKWGFRFKPETIAIADVTAEGAQTWIRDISENLDYWMDTWGSYTYVWARVDKTHQ